MESMQRKSRLNQFLQPFRLRLRAIASRMVSSGGWLKPSGVPHQRYSPLHEELWTARNLCLRRFGTPVFQGYLGAVKNISDSCTWFARGPFTPQSVLQLHSSRSSLPGDSPLAFRIPKAVLKNGGNSNHGDFGTLP
jgi:hypothetical protein